MLLGGPSLYPRCFELIIIAKEKPSVTCAPNHGAGAFFCQKFKPSLVDYPHSYLYNIRIVYPWGAGAGAGPKSCSLKGPYP